MGVNRAIGALVVGSLLAVAATGAAVFGIGAPEPSGSWRPVMVFVPAGRVEMRTIVDPQRRVPPRAPVLARLTRDFAIGQTEVTQAQWANVMHTAPSHSTGEPRRPVEQVSWLDALQYLNRLSILEGLEPCYALSSCTGEAGMGCRDTSDWGCVGPTCGPVRFSGLDCTGYRLPTEAEWEYAARAGEQTMEAWGHASLRSWSVENSDGQTHPVASRLPNQWGLYDMVGNVWELTQDELVIRPAGGVDPIEDNPRWQDRVAKGGAYDVDAFYMQPGAFLSHGPTSRHRAFGFRPARTLP